MKEDGWRMKKAINIYINTATINIQHLTNSSLLSQLCHATNEDLYYVDQRTSQEHGLQTPTRHTEGPATVSRMMNQTN